MCLFVCYVFVVVFICKQVAMRLLIERNEKAASDDDDDNHRMPLPFVLLSTNQSTLIDCTIASDRKDCLLSFDNTFEMSSHLDVLKRINLFSRTSSSAAAAKHLPLAFHPYIPGKNKQTKIKQKTCKDIISFVNFNSQF